MCYLELKCVDIDKVYHILFKKKYHFTFPYTGEYCKHKQPKIFTAIILSIDFNNRFNLHGNTQREHVDAQSRAGVSANFNAKDFTKQVGATV